MFMFHPQTKQGERYIRVDLAESDDMFYINAAKELKVNPNY